MNKMANHHRKLPNIPTKSYFELAPHFGGFALSGPNNCINEILQSLNNEFNNDGWTVEKIGCTIFVVSKIQINPILSRAIKPSSTQQADILEKSERLRVSTTSEFRLTLINIIASFGIDIVLEKTNGTLILGGIYQQKTK